MALPSEESDLTAVALRPDFEIITTLAYSAGFASHSEHEATSSAAEFCFALQYGLDRLLAAAIDFSWSRVISDLRQSGRLFSLAKEIEVHMLAEHPEDKSDASKLFIIRLAYSASGKLSIASGPRHKYSNPQYYIRSLHTLPASNGAENVFPVISVYLDTGSVTSSLFTKHKTTFRNEYTAARTRMGLTPSTPITGGEVLLQNHKGEVIGGGFTTAYFLRQGIYTTPAVEAGAKAGVSRRWALEHAGVKEGTVLARDIMDGEMIWLSSAVTGFIRGIVKERKSND